MLRHPADGCDGPDKQNEGGLGGLLSLSPSERLWPRPPLFATLPSPLLSQSLSASPSLPQDGRTFLKRHLGRASSAPKLSVAHQGERESDAAEYIFVIGLNWWARNMPTPSRSSFLHAQQVGLNHHRVTTESHFLSDAKNWNGGRRKMFHDVTRY